jgi:hypothetical protein
VRMHPDGLRIEVVGVGPQCRHGLVEGDFMSVTQRYLAAMLATDSYAANSPHRRWDSDSIRTSPITAARVSSAARGESADHD